MTIHVTFADKTTGLYTDITSLKWSKTTVTARKDNGLRMSFTLTDLTEFRASEFGNDV